MWKQSKKRETALEILEEVKYNAEKNRSHNTSMTLIKMFLQFMLEIKVVGIKNFSGRNRVV